MAGGAPIPLDKQVGLSANWGNFDGENAFALGAAARLADGLIFSAGLGIGVDSGTVGGRAGVSFAW